MASNGKREKMKMRIRPKEFFLYYQDEEEKEVV